jgi:hypothetical protein
MTTRNDAFEFARRTKKNLVFLENARADGADVHPVTQLALSLLGLVAFPREEERVQQAAKEVCFKEMGPEWGSWVIELERPNRPTHTLDDLTWHIRNSVAHGRIRFLSDSRIADDVVIVAEDGPDNRPANWRATISGSGLRRFCMQFLQFIENETG